MSQPANHVLPVASEGAARAVRADLMALTKARLSALVVFTTLGGWGLGAIRLGRWDGWELAHTLFGTTLCACGAAVFNQLIEIDADGRMTRTSDRPLPARRIPPVAAFALAMLLSAWGIVHLANRVNVEASALAAATLATYVLIYTPLKQHSTWNTVVGAVSGAFPPVIGWAAAAGPETSALGFRWEWLNRAESWWLFAVLFFWQLPHFLAINWMYREEYIRGGFVMWSNDDASGTKTSRLSLMFSLCLLPVALMPSIYGFGTWPATVAGLLLALWLVWLSVSFQRQKTRASARKLFFATLAYLPLMLGAILVFAKQR